MTTDGPQIPLDTPDKMFNFTGDASAPGAGPSGDTKLPDVPAAEGLGTNNMHAEAPAAPGALEISTEALRRGEPWGIKIGAQQVSYQIVTEGGTLRILTADEGEGLRPMADTAEGMDAAVSIIEQDIMQRDALARATIKTPASFAEQPPAALSPAHAAKAPAGVPGSRPTFQRIEFKGTEITQGDTCLWVPADASRGTRAARIAAFLPHVEGEDRPAAVLTIVNPVGFPTLDLVNATRRVPIYVEGEEIPPGTRAAIVRKQAPASPVTLEQVREAIKAGALAATKGLADQIKALLDESVTSTGGLVRTLSRELDETRTLVGKLQTRIESLEGMPTASTAGDTPPTPEDAKPSRGKRS